MHAFEHKAGSMAGPKATRLLTPVAKPLRGKHDNITDLRLRRLTQTTERVCFSSFACKRHWKSSSHRSSKTFATQMCATDATLVFLSRIP